MQHIPLILSAEDLVYLRQYKHDHARRSVRQLNRANILLLLNKEKTETAIADFLDVERTTVWRTKKRYLDKGLLHALEEDPRPGQPKKYTITHQAELVALACSRAPEGAERWTLSLLTRRIRSAVKGCRRINRESIRLMLKKTGVSLG